MEQGGEGVGISFPGDYISMDLLLTLTLTGGLLAQSHANSRKTRLAPSILYIVFVCLPYNEEHELSYIQKIMIRLWQNLSLVIVRIFVVLRGKAAR